MSRAELVKIRMKFLKEFDDYVKNIIGDEDILEQWLTYGLPDGYNETDLEEIAEDDEGWVECVEAFANALDRAEREY